MFKSVIASLFLFTSLLASADEKGVEGAVVLEAVEGSAPVEVLRGGAWGQAAVGVTMQPGESLRTTSSSARLVYEDGSIVALSTETEVKLAPEPGRVLELERGTVWGKITKAAPPSPVASTPTATESKTPTQPAAYKFTLRSQAIVMGVRGTEFLVESGSKGEAAVHTLEGTVDTAPDMASLRAGKGVPVHQLERIRARAGTPFGRGEPFKMEEFKTRLTKEHGGLARFLSRPVRPVRPMQTLHRRTENEATQFRRKAGTEGTPRVDEGRPGTPSRRHR